MGREEKIAEPYINQVTQTRLICYRPDQNCLVLRLMVAVTCINEFILRDKFQYLHISLTIMQLMYSFEQYTFVFHRDI